MATMHDTVSPTVYENFIYKLTSTLELSYVLSIFWDIVPRKCQFLWAQSNLVVPRGAHFPIT